MDENDVLAALKTLEGNNYDSEVALFDDLIEAGVPLCKGYRSGKNNRESARRTAERYVEYKKQREINPAYKNKRAVTITQIHDPPKPKEDERGDKGRFANMLKPLITYTVMDSNFQGTKADLFDLWNVYDNYREEQIKAGLFNPFKGHSFNPWKITKATPPGAAKYHQVVNYKENNSLEDALNSLHKKGIIEWKPCIMYVPIIKTTEFVDSIDRLKTWKEYSEDCNKRLELIAQLAETENCVLSGDVARVLI